METNELDSLKKQNADLLLALRQAAQAATPGPWLPVDGGWIDGPENAGCVVQYEGCGSHNADWDKNDLHFVLTANPSAILLLLDYIEAMQSAAQSAPASAPEAGDLSAQRRAMFQAFSECVTAESMLPQEIADRLLAARPAAANADGLDDDDREKLVSSIQALAELATGTINALGTDNLLKPGKQKAATMADVKRILPCVVSKLRAVVGKLDGASAPAEKAGSLGPVEGDLLPSVGSKVLVHLGRQDAWVEHTVTGYYAWGDLGGNDSLHRVFVRVVDSDGYPNARLLKDVRRTSGDGAPVSAPACRGCDPAEGFCRQCREAEQREKAAAADADVHGDGWHAEEGPQPGKADVYEVDPDESGPWYSYWNGSHWGWLTKNFSEAVEVAGQAEFPRCQWRPVINRAAAVGAAGQKGGAA